MAIAYHGYRRQQIVYGTTLVFALVGCVASGMVNRFNDIDFDTARLEQLHSVTSVAQPFLYTNAALAGFSFSLLVTDLFRSHSVPVWFELLWTFIFGTLEVVNLVMNGMRYPTYHCATSTLGKLRRRDGPTDSVMGAYSDYQTGPNRDKIIAQASSEFCANWSVMVVIFTMTATLLFIQLGWLTLLGLRHRFSHPTFWTYATPSPYTWHLESTRSTRPADVESIISTTSSVNSTQKEKALQLPISAFTPQEGQR